MIKKKLLEIVAWSVAGAVLVGGLVYYNFIDKEPVTPPDDSADYGTGVGDLCYGVDIPLFDETGELFESFNDFKIKEGL